MRNFDISVIGCHSYDIKFLKLYKDLLNHSNHFYLGDMKDHYYDPSIDYYDYPIDILPYPITSFELFSENKYHNFIVAHNNIHDAEAIRAEGLGIKYLYTVKIFFKNFLTNQFEASAQRTFVFKDLNTKTLYIKHFDEISLIRDIDVTYDASVLNFITISTRQLLYILSLLNCSNIKVEKVSEPKKLNKKRKITGKPLLREYRTVELDLRDQYAIEYSRNPDNYGTGTCKRLHFRRGHIRKISSGKTVWISHCMAGRKELGLIDKEYECLT